MCVYLCVCVMNEVKYCETPQSLLPPDARVDLSLYLGLQVERIICHPQGSSCESSSIFFPLLEDPPSQRTQITHKHTHQGPCHPLYLNQEAQENNTKLEKVFTAFVLN